MIFSESVTFAEDEVGRVITSGRVTLTQDDPRFLDSLRSGEAVAFDQLVDQYSGEIYGLLCRLTDDPEEARDLTQDTFLRALKAIGGFRGDSSLKTWLFRIAVNESRNRFRWWKRRRRSETISLDVRIGDGDRTLHDTLADETVGPEQELLARERETRLTDALAKVRETYREAVVLCDIEGLSYEETAAALGVNLGTVKSRISRGREELRRRLKDI